MLGSVDSFSNKWLASLREQTVSHYWLTCFNNKRFKEFIFDLYPKELRISGTPESTSVAFKSQSAFQPR